MYNDWFQNIPGKINMFRYIVHVYNLRHQSIRGYKTIEANHFLTGDANPQLYSRKSPAYCISRDVIGFLFTINIRILVKHFWTRNCTAFITKGIGGG